MSKDFKQLFNEANEWIEKPTEVINEAKTPKITAKNFVSEYVAFVLPELDLEMDKMENFEEAFNVDEDISEERWPAVEKAFKMIVFPTFRKIITDIRNLEKAGKL